MTTKTFNRVRACAKLDGLTPRGSLASRDFRIFDSPSSSTRGVSNYAVSLEGGFSVKTCSIEGCDRKSEKRGWCNMHYKRYVRHGRHDLKTVEQRFWDSVDTSGECWAWTGARNRAGYGQFKIKGVSHTATRAFWLLFEGVSLPADVFVCHRCDNPPCVRPDHLFLGTAADNMADMIAKGRGKFPGPKNPVYATGERHPLAKLTTAQAREIYQRRSLGEQSKDLAAEFGVHPNTVYRIFSGRGWPDEVRA